MGDFGLCFSRLVGALLAASFFTSPSFAQATDEKKNPLVYYSQAECLREKADMYRATVQDGPGLIFVGFCEADIVKPAPGQINPETTVNSLQDSVIRFTEKQRRDVPGLGNLPENMRAVVLVLSWDEIECIRDKFQDVVGEVERTRFVRSSADGEVEDSVAELKLNDCGE